jgi:hypothetical protein
VAAYGFNILILSCLPNGVIKLYLFTSMKILNEMSVFPKAASFLTFKFYLLKRSLKATGAVTKKGFQKPLKAI